MGHRCRYKNAIEYVQSFFPHKKKLSFLLLTFFSYFFLVLFVPSQIISVLYNTKAFNSDLSTWNVDAVTDMANSTYGFFTHRQKVGVAWTFWSRIFLSISNN